MEKVIYKGQAYTVFTLEAFNRTRKVICVPRQYNNGTLAILILEANEEFEPWATLTVNLSSPFQNDTNAYVDMNNNGSWAKKFINANKLGKGTCINTISGHCIYPLYHFDTTKFFAE